MAQTTQAAADAQQLYTPAEYAEMQRLVDINTQLAALEKEKKTLNEKVKKNMLRLNVDKMYVGNAVFSVTESTRKTLPKDKHDAFIAELIAKQKQNLIVTTIEPDLDAVMDEVDAGTLEQAFVGQYVKVTPVTTLRCNL